MAGKNKKQLMNASVAKAAVAKIALRKEAVAKTKGQARAVRALEASTISIIRGPAGSGKSYLTMFHAAQLLSEGKIDYLLISRPMIGVGNKDIGHLPGTEVEKVLPYLAPLMEALKEFIGADIVKKLTSEGKIRIVPVSLLRGYTFKNSMTVIDEAQNLTPLEIKTILTRVGENSSLVFLGDADQIDLKGGYPTTGFADLEERLEENPGDVFKYLTIVKLQDSDVVRSDAVRALTEFYRSTKQG